MNKIKMYIISCFVLCVFGLLFPIIGFASQAAEYEWPKNLIISAPTGGGQYTNILGWAGVLEQSTGMKVRVVPNDVGPTRAKQIRERDADFECESLGAYAYHMEATYGSALRDGGPFQVRIGWISKITNRGYIVRGDSPIKTIYDIGPGTKFAQPLVHPGIGIKNLALAAWLNLDKEDIVEVNCSSMGETFSAIAEGRADITNSASSGADIIQFVNNPKGMRMLPLPYEEDPEGAARWLEVDPIEAFGTISYGIEEMVGLPGVASPSLHFWSADADPDLVYNLTKWFVENYDAYKDNESSLVSATLDNFREVLNYTPFPVHEGTIRYLKEKGLWNPEDDIRQERNIELIESYIKAYQEAIAKADETNIQVNPSNQKWIDLWENYKKELNLTQFKNMY